MVRLLPERRAGDDALIAFILDLFNRGNVTLLKEGFGLSDREVAILGKRFLSQETYKAIGSGYGIKRERVRQILLGIYARFRHPSYRPLWDSAPRAERPLDTPLSDTLLSTGARKALYGLGIRRMADLVGKTRHDFTVTGINRVTTAEIEREMAEYGLSFQRGEGLKKNQTIGLVNGIGDGSPGDRSLKWRRRGIAVERNRV